MLGLEAPAPAGEVPNAAEVCTEELVSQASQSAPVLSGVSVHEGLRHTGLTRTWSTIRSFEAILGYIDGSKMGRVVWWVMQAVPPAAEGFVMKFGLGLACVTVLLSALVLPPRCGSSPNTRTL